MTVEIRSRWDNSVIYTSHTAADARSAVTEAVRAGADLRGAYLRGAYLGDAYLGDADLRGADLRGADLRDADLRGADLRGAYLRGAKGINKYVTSPLYLLLEQTGPIRAYKLVDGEYRSPVQPGRKLTYRPGETVAVPDASTDETVQCAAGINVASLDWCIREWRAGWRVMVVEFDRADIAAVPVGSDGKFRVRRCTVVGEKNLVEIGLGSDVEVAG